MSRYVLLFLFLQSLCFSVEAIYLTFPQDPSTSMAIHWLEEKRQVPALFYRERGTKQEWKRMSAHHVSVDEYVLKKVGLFHLKADVEYEFYLEEQKEVYFFRTLPSKLVRPIRVAIGGDSFQAPAIYRKMNAQVAKQEPDFAIIGGDIAYANDGKPIKQWKNFWKEWWQSMRAPDGRMIPILAAIGNHDIAKKRTLFQEFFPYLEQGSYGRVDCAASVSFFLLDTDHMAPIEGAQARWLAKSLAQGCKHRVPVYHVAAYPSFYSIKSKKPKTIQKEWCSLFEEFHVGAAFEHHNHAFKKTYPIAKGKVHPSGVVYFGDGAWGAEPRDTLKGTWYLEKASATNNFFLLTVSRVEDGVKLLVQGIDLEGSLLDEWTQTR